MCTPYARKKGCSPTRAAGANCSSLSRAQLALAVSWSGASARSAGLRALQEASAQVFHLLCWLW